jgi:carnitine O-octanoyltransferase
MDQFRNLFNVCRIPLVNKDRLDFHFKTVSEGECPTHLIVMYKYRFFKMDIIHENKMLTITEFYNQFESIMNKYGNMPNGIGIGALTADYRDDWARVSLNSLLLKNFLFFLLIILNRIDNI